MSHNLLFAAAAGAMLVTAPALAATASKHATHMQSASQTKAATTKAASTKTASSKTTPAKMASTTAMPAKTVHHRSKMAKSEHHKKTAENVGMQGSREVDALNTLESAGYRQFNDLHASGTDFTATAMKAGKSYDVTVTPAGKIDATRT